MTSQQKGSAFEREVCVKLSEWVSAGQKRDIFWRTAMSGGRATVFKKKGSFYRQSGDICAVAPEGHSLTESYFFELKHYKDLNFSSFFIKGKGLLSDFWLKAQNEAADYGLSPILIIKQDRMPVLFMAQAKKLPDHWMRRTRKFRIDVVHRKCSIFRFQDIMAADYTFTVREQATRIRL